jgi:hypothetical protein
LLKELNFPNDYKRINKKGCPLNKAAFFYFPLLADDNLRKNMNLSLVDIYLFEVSRNTGFAVSITQTQVGNLEFPGSIPWSFSMESVTR